NADFFWPIEIMFISLSVIIAVNYWQEWREKKRGSGSGEQGAGSRERGKSERGAGIVVRNAEIVNYHQIFFFFIDVNFWKFKFREDWDLLPRIQKSLLPPEMEESMCD
ncbi:MAG: hypothetical protein ACYTX0_49175, partial [Nostoc sp.]